MYSTNPIQMFCIQQALINKVGLPCAAFYTVIVNKVVSEQKNNDPNCVSVSITIQDFIKKIGITKHNQAKYRKELESLGVLKATRKGLPARLYFTIDTECERNLEKLLLS